MPSEYEALREIILQEIMPDIKNKFGDHFRNNLFLFL
jgi:hypothetical protein